jgi:protein gp37
MGQARYRNGFQATCHEDALQEPLQYKRSQMIFVASLGDLFHPDVPDDFIRRVFEVMNRAHWHTFQVLTKRAKRLQALAPKLAWSRNIWMGVTVESDRHIDRIAYLVDTPACIKWLCLEPLLSPIHSLPLNNIHWVIASGENAPDARPTEAHWVADIQNQCREHDVAFYFKKDPRALTDFPLHSVLQCVAIRKTLQGLR